MNFKPGDLVQLKSGGPTMTVMEVDGDNVRCNWFHMHEIKTHLFKAAVLHEKRD